jgi:ABC-type glycerol-3-phosphate transport system permease component
MDTTKTIHSPSWYRLQKILGNMLWYVMLTGLGILFSLPFFWMVSSSLKIEARIWVYPPEWIPDPVMWSNYPEALKQMDFGRLLANTAFLTGVGTLFVVISSSWITYGFARFQFPGRNALFAILLSTMMIPGQVTMIPTFILFRELNWLNTYKPLLVPALFGSPFYIFLLRQFFMTIPTELDEAAKIDGCSYIGIWWRILLPLTKPALATVSVFSIIYGWNDFLWPLIVLNDESKFNLSLGLSTFRGVYQVKWSYLMAASVVTLLPCIALYFFAQRYIIEGVTLTGLKG